MEPKYYVVSRIDGDYAWLTCTSVEEDPFLLHVHCSRWRLMRVASLKWKASNLRCFNSVLRLI